MRDNPPRDVFPAKSPVRPFDAVFADMHAWGKALRQVLERRYELSFLGYSIWDADRALFVERVLIPKDAEPVHLGIDDLDSYGFGLAVRSGEPRLVTDLEREATRRGEWIARENFETRSYLSLPLRVDGRVVGAFGLGSPAVGHFAKRDLEVLSPLMELFELILDGRRLAPPPPLERPSLIEGQPVVLVSLDETLGDALVRALPEGVQVRRAADLGEAERAAFAPLSVICSTRLTRKLAERIARSLRRAPRRTLVLCRRARLSTVHDLVGEARRLGLLKITSPDEIMDERRQLASWYYSGVVLPDWSALGVDRDSCSEILGRAIEAIEQDPFHDWRVDELAQKIGVSARTLRRILLAEPGLRAKEFLMTVRYQLVDRFRKESDLRGEEMAGLFEFASGKKLSEWCGRFEEDHS